MTVLQHYCQQKSERISWCSCPMLKVCTLDHPVWMVPDCCTPTAQRWPKGWNLVPDPVLVLEACSLRYVLGKNLYYLFIFLWLCVTSQNLTCLSNCPPIACKSKYVVDAHNMYDICQCSNIRQEKNCFFLVVDASHLEWGDVRKELVRWIPPW